MSDQSVWIGLYQLTVLKDLADSEHGGDKRVIGVSCVAVQGVEVCKRDRDLCRSEDTTKGGRHSLRLRMRFSNRDDVVEIGPDWILEMVSTIATAMSARA
jgi:hypothetical protein